MIDYTSSLYLDMRHGSRELRPWRQLTTGSPAAIASVPGTVRAEPELALLLGCERAVLCRSTLHAFVDVLETLGGEGSLRIYKDAGAYPIGSWAVERRQGLGDPVETFPEHDTSKLFRLLERDRWRPGLPVIVADSVSIAAGSLAPLQDYDSLARSFGGYLVVDDTKGVGLLGSNGGGALRSLGIRSSHVLVIASLAKAFGVPVAVLAGMRGMVERFRRDAPSRYHSSAPSAADVAAVLNALRINRLCGDRLRSRLFRSIRLFRAGLRRGGLEPGGGMFPLQTLPAMAVSTAQAVHSFLARSGIRALLLSAAGKTARVGFVITARHTLAELRSTIDAVGRATSTAFQNGALACTMN